MILQDRDIYIFRFIQDMKVVCAEDIMNWFFGGKGAPAYRRIKKFEEAGFIVRKRVALSKRNYIFLTQPALDLVRGEFEEIMYPEKALKDIDWSTVRHDIVVLRARKYIEKKWDIKEWISEYHLRNTLGEKIREMKKNGRNNNITIPDAGIILKDGTYIAFELELTEKSIHRTKEKLDGLCHLLVSWDKYKKSFDRVLFITGTRKLLLRTKRIYEKYDTGGKEKFDFAALEELE